jgi:nucleoside-diphosphate-sugar epimerase
MHRILIAGCGYVGTALGEQLAAEGCTVFGLRRDITDLPASIHGIAADLSRPDTLHALPEVDTIYYTAGSSAHTDDAYRAAYVDGLRNLLDAIPRETAPRRVIFTSSTAVYAQNDGDWVNEDSATEPDSFSGRRLLEAERLLAASPYETIAVRLGGIYGPGRTGLIDRVRRGDARRERDRVRWLNLIHRDDIVGALIHLMRLDHPAPTYIGVDNDPQDYNALVEWLADRVGVPPPPFSDESQTRGRAAHNRRCTNARLRASGYTFKVPSARQGYDSLLRD